MKIATLLILWSSTFLHAGGREHPDNPGPAARHGHHVASAVIQPPAAGSSLDRLGGGNAGSSLWDEEDDLDDDPSDTALLLPSSPLLRGGDRPASRSRSRGRILRSPDRLIPLRC